MKKFVKFMSTLTLVLQCCISSLANHSSSLQQSHKRVGCTNVMTEGEKCHQVGNFAILGDCTKYQACEKQEGKIEPYLVYCPKGFYFNGYGCVPNEKNITECDHLHCTPIKIDSMELNDTVADSSNGSRVNQNGAIFPIQNESFLITNDMIRKMIEQKDKNMTIVKNEKIAEENIPADPLQNPLQNHPEGNDKNEKEENVLKENENATRKSMMEIQKDIDQKDNDTDVVTLPNVDNTNDDDNLTSSKKMSFEYPPTIRIGKGQSDTNHNSVDSTNSHQGTTKESSKVNSAHNKAISSTSEGCKQFFFDISTRFVFLFHFMILYLLCL